MKENIEKWKKEHGDVFLIEVEDKKCYLKKPDRKTLSLAMTKAQTNPLAFAEIIMKNCWLAGDECMREDDTYFFAASSKLDALVEVKTAEIKKL